MSICREFPYSSWKTLTYHETIVIVDGVVVEPVKKELTSPGYGKYIYCLPEDKWNRSWIITLSKPLPGERMISFKGVPDDVASILKEMWVDEGFDPVAIEWVATKFYKIKQKS